MKTATLTRAQLKEIVRRTYLKSVNENLNSVDEGMKTQIANILGAFFGNENNLEFQSNSWGGLTVLVKEGMPGLDEALSKLGVQAAEGSQFELVLNDFNEEERYFSE